jgi:hypothetical protein
LINKLIFSVLIQILPTVTQKSVTIIERCYILVGLTLENKVVCSLPKPELCNASIEKELVPKEHVISIEYFT